MSRESRLFFPSASIVKSCKQPFVICLWVPLGVTRRFLCWKAHCIGSWINPASFLYFSPIPPICSRSYIFSVHHLFGNFVLLSPWISVCKSKTQPKQTRLNIIIILWHCFSIFADLCFCFQPFLIKKGFPTPSELEECAVLFSKIKESPCFASPDRGEIIYWGLAASCSFGPRCFPVFRGSPKTCISQNCRTLRQVWVFDAAQIRLWDWL